MSDHRKRPKKPVVVKVPNKIRRRITAARELDRQKG